MVGSAGLELGRDIVTHDELGEDILDFIDGKVATRTSVRTETKSDKVFGDGRAGQFSGQEAMGIELVERGGADGLSRKVPVLDGANDQAALGNSHAVGKHDVLEGTVMHGEAIDVETEHLTQERVQEGEVGGRLWRQMDAFEFLAQLSNEVRAACQFVQGKGGKVGCRVDTGEGNVLEIKGSILDGAEGAVGALQAESHGGEGGLARAELPALLTPDEIRHNKLHNEVELFRDGHVAADIPVAEPGRHDGQGHAGLDDFLCKGCHCSHETRVSANVAPSEAQAGDVRDSHGQKIPALDGLALARRQGQLFCQRMLKALLDTRGEDVDLLFFEIVLDRIDD